MVNRAAYKGEKRQKELARQKRQEEKRLRRLAKRSSGQKDGDEIVDGEEYAEPVDGEADDDADEPAEEPAEIP